MRQSIDIVLGLGYGDEGKGRVVDQLCSRKIEPIVVRFSGGQQCGHTVINQYGKHIHASFPSGTLAGHDGYISEHCTVSPTHLVNEWKVLSRLQNGNPKLFIHPHAMVTTPWDIRKNREDVSNIQHGTCGMGVGATVKRHTETPYKFHVIDLFNDELLLAKLDQFNNQYGNISTSSDLKDFHDSVITFRNIVKLSVYNVLKNYSDIVFEGSQGILLDKDHGVFPHVTNSNTTSKNALEIINNLQTNSDVRMHYVTRCYSTRHGNGPFPNEATLNLKNTAYEINVCNKWQGAFKTRKLDLKLIRHAIDIDTSYHSVGVTRSLHVTCLDQLENTINFEKEFSQFEVHSYNQPHQL